jgi:hypothetical protein
LRKLNFVLTVEILLCFSEKVYGILFQAVGAVATALFQKSSELQLHFLKVVSENLQFKCMHKDGLVQLTES